MKKTLLKVHALIYSIVRMRVLMYLRGCFLIFISTSTLLALVLIFCFNSGYLVEIAEAQNSTHHSAHHSTYHSTHHSTHQACRMGEALIHLELSQFGSMVWIDGLLMGRAPISPRCLLGGPHLIEIKQIDQSTSSTTQSNRSTTQSPTKATIAQFIWLPNYGSWTLDLSHLSFKKQQPKRPKTLINNEKKNINSLQENTKKDSNSIFLVFQGSFGGLNAISAPKHRMFLSAHELSLDTINPDQTDERLKQGLRFKAHLISLQDLIPYDLPLHHALTWNRSERELFVRSLGVEWRTNQGWEFKAGREIHSFGKRLMLLDGLSVQKTNLPFELKHGWSFQFAGTLGRSADQVMRFTHEHQQTQVENLNPQEWRSLIKAETHYMSEIAQLHLTSGLLSPLSSFNQTMTSQNPFDQTSLWLMRSSGSIKNFVLSGEVSFYLDQYDNWLDKMSEAHLSASFTPFTPTQKTTTPINTTQQGIALVGNWKSGDRWDRIIIPGEIWPQAYGNGHSELCLKLWWSKFSLDGTLLQGSPPIWHNPRLTSSLTTQADPDQLMRLALSWNESINLNCVDHQRLNLLNQASREMNSSFKKPLGLNAQVIFWSTQHNARYWGLNPWSELDPNLPTQRIALGLGWRTHGVHFANGQISLATRIYLDPLGLAHSFQLFKSSQANRELSNSLWGELHLKYQIETFQLATYCGKPIELPKFNIPNSWLFQCGVRLSVSANLKL